MEALMTPLEAQIKATDEAAVLTLIHATTAALKKAKAAYNTPGRPDFKLWQHIPRLKHVATILCAAQATRHNRVHRADWGWDRQVGIVSEELPHILTEARIAADLLALQAA
jgi:hypothetical protein